MNDSPKTWSLLGLVAVTAVVAVLVTVGGPVVMFLENLGFHKLWLIVAVPLALAPGFWMMAVILGQRRRISQQLQQRGELLDLADDAIIVIDMDGRIALWNSGAERKYGWTKQEVTGRNCSELLKTRTPRPMAEIKAELLEKGSWKGELVHTARDGSHVVNESRWSLARNSQGEPIAMLEINHDITERNRVLEALRKSEESLRRLLATIPHSILVYDAGTSSILEANKTAIATYGYTLAEFRSLKIEDLLRPEQLVSSFGHSARASHSPLSSGEWKQRTKRGRVFDAEISRHPFNLHGKAAVLVVVQDITRRKQLEIELRQAQKLESVGQLAAGIAHEINTPTQYVGDNVRFLKEAFEELVPAIRRDTSPGEDLNYLLQEVPRAIDQALEGVSRVSSLVRAMREFSHPGSTEKGLVDLRASIDNTIAVSRNEWKYVADLVTDYDPDLPAVPCLLNEFNQVILNLITNAAHAIRDVVGESGNKGRITIRTRQSKGWAEVQVEDTGTGIPEEVRDRVFDPFFTTKQIGKGTGQGLAIARSVVVDKHAGTIHFDTQPGKGTTFILRLPLATQLEAATPAQV